MKTVIFSAGQPSWVATDLEILKSFGEAEIFNHVSRGWKCGLNAFQAIVKADLCYFWFGSLRHLPYIVCAKVLRKKIAIVAGGYDVNGLSSIGYGVSNDGTLARLSRRFMFNCADHILAVSQFTRTSAIENLKLNEEKIRVAPLAFQNFASEKPSAWAGRKQQVIFLLSAHDEMFKVKGIDRIPALCRKLPSVEFKLVGSLGPLATKLLTENKPANLELLGYVDFHGKEYLEILNSSRAVCLPSRLESFGAALIDGAIQGCIPVAFSVGAIPEVIEGLGVIVTKEDTDAMAAAIEEVLHTPSVDTGDLKAKALEKFSFARRKQELERVL